MNPDTQTRPSTPQTVVRATATLVAMAALALWVFVGLFLFAWRCTVGCNGDRLDNWLYSAQLVLAILGCGLGTTGLVLTYTRHRAASLRLATAGFGCFLLWIVATFSAGL